MSCANSSKETSDLLGFCPRSHRRVKCLFASFFFASSFLRFLPLSLLFRSFRLPNDDQLRQLPIEEFFVFAISHVPFLTAFSILEVRGGNEMKSPIRILTVDGGGVGGIIPARILERLHAQNPKIIDQADLVAGTSTGGLIALGLAYGKTPGQLCDIYQEKVKDIFSARNRRFRVFRLCRAKFAPDGLRGAIKAIVDDRTLEELTAKPVLVPVTAVQRADQHHRPAGIFVSTAWRLTANQANEKYASSKWKCVDVGLSTAAAPTYFPAHTVTIDANRKWVCWDGGVVANNPALAAVGEVLRLDLAERNVDARSHPAETPDIRVLSLGTGYRNIEIAAGDWGLIQSARPVVATLMDASVGSTAFLLRQFLGKRAVRVSIPLKADYEMDDPSVLADLDSQAIDFTKIGISKVSQPDGTNVDLNAWLEEFWY